MWCNDYKAAQNSLLQLLNYTSIYQIWNNGQRGRGVALYVHNSLNFKVPKNQRKNANNMFVSCIYQPPRDDSNKCLGKIKALIYKNDEKPLFLVGDFNVNSLDNLIITNACDFFNLVYKSNKIKCNNN